VSAKRAKFTPEAWGISLYKLSTVGVEFRDWRFGVQVMGESVVEWCLGSSSVGKNPVEIQHAQKSTELTGGLRRRAVQKMGHSILQWSGTLGGHFVTEQDDLRCSEDTLVD
jgi:hypothetical protein